MFIYCYIALDIWLRITQIKSNTHCCHLMGHYFELAARDLLYAPFYKQDSARQVNQEGSI